ncbi:MAG TPA: carboxypeptidase-like regulatory domain-containing protein [Terriglobales bacterium]|nr:carboxypeptidase-like regulatory domain-containing protein [Terriglobales bacterium]
MLATSKGVTFSGTVTDQNGKPIPGAQLVVNGRVTNANSKGKAELAVPVQDKYAVTVSQPVPNPPAQPAYGAASFIYTSGIRGAQWRLRPAQVATFDPTLPIVLQHVRTRKDCDATRPRLSKIDWTPYLRPGLFDWQDGAGNSLSLAEMVLNHPEAIRQATLLLARTNPELAKFFFDTANSSIIPKSFGNTGHGRGTVHFDRSDEVHPFVFDFSILDNGGILGDEGSPPYVSQALPCRNGIKVEIPPNSLENPATKKPPSGPVQVAVSMVDLNGPDQMPGDYTAIDSSGQRTAMESYGAGSVEISSGAERFNLKAGATATVTIPVDSTQLVGAPVLPATIPILFYDESAGVWKEDGTGHLIGSGVSSVYVTTRTHFSPLNGDILKSGESCVAVEVDPMAGFTFPLSVEVNLQPSRPNPTAVQVRTLTINSSGEHSVIYNLPNNEDIALTPIIPGTLPNGDSGDVPAGIFVVNTGGAQNSPTAPPTPNADGTYYNGTSGPCASKVTLKKLNASTAPGAPYEFLQGLYFESSNISEFASDPNTVNIANAIVQGAKDYYLQADARNKRPDLNSFKQVNRFGQLQSPPDEVEFSAVYANGGDLGFGREMHCRRNLAADSTPADKKFDYACYVSNCHQPPIFLADQQDADDTNAHTCDVTDATVAMEYSRVENPSADPQEFPDNNRAVKFYAYNTNAGTQVFQADLDGHGARPLPNLCVVCHGGRSADGIADASTGAKKPAFTARSDIINEGSKFLPFDLHYYKFPALNLRSAQEDSFRNLNIEIVEQVATQINATDPVAELIDAWYPGHVGIQRDDAVIVGWDTGGAGNPNHQDNRMYRDVFARACRTCHVAQPYAGPTFTTVASFKNDIQTVQQRVCINKVMPHAQRTSDIFWTSLNPNMPGFLEIFGQPEAGWLTDINSQCGLFNQDSNSLRSFFEGTVYPVLTSNCASSNCHGQIGNANWHVGSVPATYNELLTAATNRQITGGRYVQPNNLANSLLYQKIDGTAYGSLMPLGGVDLRTHDTNGNGAVDVTDVLNWITTFAAVGP